jgi:hypothetical protein
MADYPNLLHAPQMVIPAKAGIQAKLIFTLAAIGEKALHLL